MLRIAITIASISGLLGCGSSCPRPAAVEPEPEESVPAPDVATPGPEVVPGARTDFAFPGDWTGRWYGTVTSAGLGRIDPFEMELHIEPIEGGDSYTWTIVYVLPDQRQERKYELLTVDAGAGHYRIDEKNSIIIDAYLASNALHTQFSVGSAMITIRYIREGDTIVFDLMSNRFDPAIETGGVDGIPVVSAYPLTTTQRAVLERR